MSEPLTAAEKAEMSLRTEAHRSDVAALLRDNERHYDEIARLHAVISQAVEELSDGPHPDETDCFLCEVAGRLRAALSTKATS